MTKFNFWDKQFFSIRDDKTRFFFGRGGGVGLSVSVYRMKLYFWDELSFSVHWMTKLSFWE